MARKKKIEFLMNTDWMFEKPIDQEHKEYKLLSYFQKMGEKLDRLELYPSFIELSLHFANVQTLYRNRKLLYTNKKFSSVDDELLVKDLKMKDIPEMTEEEGREFSKILSYTTPRIFEYFNVAKSVWELVFDSISLKVRKNLKNVSLNKGFILFTINDRVYLWEFEKKPAAKNSIESKINTNQIYNGSKKEFKLVDIIKTSSTFDDDTKSKLPVFEMICEGDFPIEETLLPLFKRKVISYINQKSNKQTIKEIKE
jgi:hypothetical protein